MIKFAHPLWSGMSIGAHTPHRPGVLATQFPIELEVEYPWNDSARYRMSVEEAAGLADELTAAVDAARKAI